MKTFLALEVLPFIVAANQPCDLSGILAEQPNGKFDFGDHKLKFTAGRIYDDLKLSNKGKMKKGKAEFHHRNAGDSSDAWVVCNKPGHKAQYYLSCSADGVLTVGPSKDSTGVTLPDCSNWDAATKTPICDRAELGPFTTDVAPCRKDNCFRYCGDETEGKTNRTLKKIKCNCDWATNTCMYQHKPKGSTDFVDFDPTAEKEYPNCDGGSSTPEPPTPEPPPTAEWSNWSRFSVCSTGCGDGTKTRSRTCSVEGECDGESTESTACNEGDCLGCKVNYGDWNPSFSKNCDLALTYDNTGSFLLPPKGKCPLTSCKRRTEGTLACACTKKGICTLKHDGETVADNFDSFNECTDPRNFRDGKRTFTWATGRRSPDVSVSLDEGMELLDYCYDPNWFNLYDMRPAGGDGPFWAKQTDELAALEGVHIKTTMAITNYGRVTEIVNADGERQLVCRYSNKKDFEVDREIYVQLAIRTGAVNWISSERWFPQYNHAYNLADKPAGMWSEDDWVLHAKDVYAYGVELEFNSYGLFNYGDTPARRAICRIEYEGKWYLGNVNNEGQYRDVPRWSTSSSWGSSYRSNWFTCAAFLDDGTMITAETHQLFGKPESKGGLKSEYLVQNTGNDGSSWDEWGEWTPCSKTCGDSWSATRTRTRDCNDKDGNSIDKKTGWNCLPKRRDNGDVIYDNVGDNKCEVNDGYSGDICPSWASWGDYGECSQTCGGGLQWKTRKCACGRNEALCDDSDHPLHDVADTNELCKSSSIASQLSSDSRECNDIPCDGNGMAKGDGTGPGCLSDTRYSNRAEFNCYNTVDQKPNEARGANIYENDYGFVPHNYACFQSRRGPTCDEYSQVEEGMSQNINSDDPVICNCNAGSCKWENMANPDANAESVRADCTRGYEWIKLPIAPGSEFYDSVVDFTTGKTGGEAATSAIVVQKIAYAPAANFIWDPIFGANWARRVPIDPVEKDDAGVFDKNGRDAYALVAQCDAGEMNWVEGPYECTETCDNGRDSCFNDGWGGFQCSGSPRVNPFYDSIKKFNKDMDSTSAADWSVDAWVVAMCRFKDENDEWKMGNLLQFQWHYKYKSGWSSYWSSKEEDFQCCPVGGSGATGTPSDTLGCWPQRTLYQKEFQGEGGSYAARPYQILDSFNCKTAGMGYWSEWSEWSDCSKQCSNGQSEGVRTKTRTCVNANVGEFGCHDSSTTEIKERCNMAQTADCDNSNRCTLDLNYIDWKRFRLGHNSGYESHYAKQTAFWADQGVYYNVRENGWEGEKWSDKNGFLKEKTWTGTFPEGSMVSGFRCVDPNTSARGAEEHSATCVCADGECNWDRQLPVCTTHGQNHSGYSWTITSSPEAGSICVSANTGGVGVVLEGECIITMANEVNPFYMISNDAEAFKAAYPAFNNYYDSGDARAESEFHTLSANDDACSDAFSWVAISDLTDDSAMVNAPRMYNQYEMINTLPSHMLDQAIYPTRWTQPGPYKGTQKTGICRVTYEDGKVCYGQYFDGKCGDYDVTGTEDNDSYYSYTYEVMVLADKDGCSAPAAHDWSACSVDCGLGTSTNGDESRTCHAVCETSARSGQYCSVPKYPNDSNPQSSGKGNSNIEVFADYPVSQKELDKRKGLQLTCTGGGYWADDSITNDKYYVLAPGEKCTFSCDDSLFDKPHVLSESYPYWQSFTCSGNTGILDDYNWQHNWTQMPTCDPEFCIFPSYGQWLSKNIQGTKVQIGMNCPEGTIDNGDHVIVRKGVTCVMDCVAANGAGFRIDSAQIRETGSVTCQRPIPREHLAEYGCNNGECDTDFIAKGPNKANWPNNRIPTQFDDQQHKSWPYIDFSEQFDNADLMKCYPNIDDGCDPADLGFNEGDETAADVAWDCPDGHGSGAVCTKTCTSGFLGGKKSEKTCECKSKCQWKGAVASCERAFCVISANFAAQGGPQWPRSATCQSADGSIDYGEFDESFEYPMGTVCSDKCKQYEHITDFTEFSTCNCSDGRCSFNERKMGHCISSTCYNSVSWMFSEFELGYEHPEATSDGFVDHLVDCTETVPQDFEDQSIAGLPLMGSHCYIKCKEGYRFADADQESLDDQNRIKITCYDDWYHGMEWSILANAWDKYGDCNGDYGNNCGDYPECIPDN